MIDLGQVKIEGVQEALIRDNVIDADGSLLERALEQLVSPYKAQTYAKAQAKYAEVAGSEDAPVYTDQDAMVEWYLGRSDYKNADQVEADRVAAEQQAKVDKLNEQIAALEANLAYELTEPESPERDARVADYESQIASKTAERDAV